MLETESDNDPEDSRICHECVGETYLSAEIERSGDEGTCTYCGSTLPSLTIEELADCVETAFEQHYTRTLDHPNSFEERLMADKESSYDWDREGIPVVDAITDAADIPQAAAEDVAEILEGRHGDFEMAAMGDETEFSSGSYYEEKRVDDRYWQEDWQQFERSLKAQARFFSQIAAAHLMEVFGDIDKLKTQGDRPLVVEAGPKTKLDHLYRARAFQSDDQLEEALQRPDLQLGSPPAKMARAGRMNAQGISVFYGATRAKVGIAEVRPPVGSRVAIARFDIIRPLRLLDLTALEKVYEQGSIFDRSWIRRLERAAFLRSVCARMVRPVMPDDEALDYLPTQAIADFLATTNVPRLDGIVFPSAQTAVGRNVVLFHQAAKIEKLHFPAGTEIESSLGMWTEEGFELAYSVSESVPPPKRPNPEKGFVDDFHELYAQTQPYDDDPREAALRISPDSVQVHHVVSVNVKTNAHSVHRYRYEKRDSEF